MSPGLARRIPGLLLLLFVIGVAGTLPELVLLNHLEDWRQWIPVVLLGLGLPVAGWHAWRPGAGSRAGLRLLGVAYVVSGVVGVWLHYRGNVEFQRELDPGLGGWALVKEATTHGAPALAPGTMAWFGLLALLIPLAGPVPATTKE